MVWGGYMGAVKCVNICTWKYLSVGNYLDSKFLTMENYGKK